MGCLEVVAGKKRVREIADKARAALDEFEIKVKASWSDDLKIAYNRLVSENGDAKQNRQRAKAARKQESPKIDAKAIAAVERLKEADDAAFNAHEDAEDAFAEAEKRMSTRMAREAAAKPSKLTTVMRLQFARPKPSPMPDDPSRSP